MTKIAACLISGDAYNDEEVQKLIASLDGNIHGIFVAYNGKEEVPGWWHHLENISCEDKVFKKFKWEDDFALARNQSFSLVDREKYDYYLWIDLDDIFHVAYPGALDDMFANLDEYTQGIFIRYEYAVEPETGIIVVEQWRERILSTKIGWNWRFKIHEVAQSIGPTQLARKDHCWIEHQRKSGEDRGARIRNKRILEKMVSENPQESRGYFYLAGEYMSEADIEQHPEKKTKLANQAIELFNIFRTMRSSLDEDVFMATCRISELNRMKEDYVAALSSDMEALAIFPDWPDASVSAAKSLMEMGDWRRMKAFADIACKLSKPDTAVSIEPLNSTFTPLFLRGIANEELGEFSQALDDYKQAIEYWRPPNMSLDKRISELEARLGEESENKVDERRQLRGSNPDKSICFFTNPLIEWWHPELLKKNGAGGAETCIMELAPRFAADGWRVAVFGSPGEYRGVHEGVEYWNSQEWLPQEKFSVFISSRSPFPFEANINAKLKLLWMHDVNLGEEFHKYSMLPDKIITLSNWHTAHLMKLYNIPEKNFDIVPNGINLERFKKDRSMSTSNDPKFIWASSPDRGLDVLLGLWPLIKQYYPEAELEIYYGWNMIDKIINNYRDSGSAHLFLEQFKLRVEHQMKYIESTTGGVKWVGRVHPDELAEAFYRANYWPYATDFAETFCLTAMQAQAAGVIPIASKLGALIENVAQKQNLVEGWPHNSDYQRRFLGILDDMITDDPFHDEIRVHTRQVGRKFALTQGWDNSYARWNDLFAKMGL